MARDEGLTREDIGELYLKGAIDGLTLSPMDLHERTIVDESHPGGFPGLAPYNG